MAASLQDLIQSGQQSVAAADTGQGVGQAIQSGVQLAQTANQLKIQQQTQQENQQKLEQGKFDSSMARLKTYSAMSPEIRKRARKNLESQDAALGQPQSAIYDAIDNDPTFGQQVNMMTNTPKFMKRFGADPASANANLKGMATSGFMDEADKQAVVGQWQDFLKEEQKDNATLQKAQLVADSKIDAAQITGGTRAENSDRAEFKRISDDSTLKPLLATHGQASKDLNLLNSALLNKTPMPTQVLSEISAGMGNIVTNGNSGVSDRQAQELNNLKIEIAKASNKARLSGVATVYDPVLFGQLKDTFSRLTDAVESQIQGRKKAVYRPSKKDSINEQQDAAIKGIDDIVSSNKRLASGVPTPAAPPANILEAAKASISRGSSVDQVVKKLQAKGFKIGPEDFAGGN